jgi:hypothetical protein
MLRISEWTEFSPMDLMEPEPFYGLTGAHVFSSYFNGETDFSALRVQVVSTYRELRRNGESVEAAARTMIHEVDRGAAHAVVTDNVYRFNAIHDEVRGWVAGVCTDDAAEYTERQAAM